MAFKQLRTRPPLHGMRAELITLRNTFLACVAHVVMGCVRTQGVYLGPIACLRDGAYLSVYVSVGLCLYCMCHPDTRAPTGRALPSTYTPLLYAYGMGFFMFVFAYASSGVGLTAATGYTVGLCVLVVDDIATREQSMSTEQVAVNLLTMGLSLTSICLVLVASDWAVYDVYHTVDWNVNGVLAAIVTVCTPIVGLPLIVYCVREHAQRHKTYFTRDMLCMGAPLMGILGVCILCAFPSDDTSVQAQMARLDLNNAYPGDVNPPAGYSRDDYPATAYPADAYPAYVGFDYHNPGANNTLPPPMYAEKAATVTAGGVIAALLLLMASAGAAAPALYLTTDLFMSHQTTPVMVCVAAALAAKHLATAGDTLYNRFALAGAMMALLLEGVSVVMGSKAKPPRVRTRIEHEPTTRTARYTQQHQAEYDSTDGLDDEFVLEEVIPDT